MTLAAPSCPTCHSPLDKTVDGALDSWVCTDGHGLAITLSEGYGQMQDDEDGQAAVGRHFVEEFVERIDATRRCADADDRQGAIGHDPADDEAPHRMVRMRPAIGPLGPADDLWFRETRIRYGIQESTLSCQMATGGWRGNVAPAGRVCRHRLTCGRARVPFVAGGSRVRGVTNARIRRGVSQRWKVMR